MVMEDGGWGVGGGRVKGNLNRRTGKLTIS